MQDFLESLDFVDLMRDHVGEVVNMLIEKEMDFFIVANAAKIDFDPPLPEEIRKQFRPIVPFAISNYTLESASVDENCLSFEAGFGEDNFGSFVSIDLVDILQVIVEDQPILINLAISNDKDNHKKTQIQENAIEKSTKAFLSNPENEKFLK